jgi:hypothetical protein
MDMGIVQAALKVAEQGLRFLNERQRTKYQREYFELLQKLDDYENAIYPDYSDHAIDELRLELQRFLQAFSSELRSAHLESVRQEKGQA